MKKRICVLGEQISKFRYFSRLFRDFKEFLDDQLVLKMV